MERNSFFKRLAGLNFRASSSTVARIRSWVRRFRRLLPFPLALIVIIALRPNTSASEWIDAAITAVGLALCVLGQMLRLWTWGSNATVGKTGVRDRGPYALMRHPLYSGNFLIVSGSVVVFNNIWAYPLVLLPFAYLYHVVTEADERKMAQYFAPDYDTYRERKLPRFLPALGNLGIALRTTLPFGWAFSWRKEYRSCLAWSAGIAGLELYKQALAQGWFQSWPSLWPWAAVLGGSAMLGLALTIRKKLLNSHERRMRDPHQ